MSPKPKVIAIVGPTASGKTSLSVEVAKAFNGEVISADSRQVYKGLDIGSGKVTQEEMEGVRHHLLDVIKPNETYTGADFERDAKVAISDILSRGKTPIIAGGTFFYLDLLRGTMQTAAVEPNPKLRAELEKLTNQELFQKVELSDPKRAQVIDPDNRHRLIRTLEIIDSLGEVPEPKKIESEYQWQIFGIDIDNEDLHPRIEKRLHDRLKNGMVEEVENLLKGGLSKEKLSGFGLEYRYLTSYILKEISYEEMTEHIFAKSRQFAKRQRTWLKRDQEIIWKKFPVDLEDVKADIEGFLE